MAVKPYVVKALARESERRAIVARKAAVVVAQDEASKEQKVSALQRAQSALTDAAKEITAMVEAAKSGILVTDQVNLRPLYERAQELRTVQEELDAITLKSAASGAMEDKANEEADEADDGLENYLETATETVSVPISPAPGLQPEPESEERPTQERIDAVIASLGDDSNPPDVYRLGATLDDLQRSGFQLPLEAREAWEVIKNPPKKKGGFFNLQEFTDLNKLRDASNVIEQAVQNLKK